MVRAVVGDDLIKRLCEILNLDPNEVTHLTIVCAVDDVVRVEVSRIADEELLDFDFEGLLKDAPVSG